MEIKLIHILGPVFATVAMFFYGKALVDRGRGRQVNIVPALTLIVGSLIFVWLTGEGTFLDKICLSLLDFGIAMIIDSRYLAKHREHPKVFWVPGFLAVVISLSIWGMAYMFGWKISALGEIKAQQAAESAMVQRSHAAQIESGEVLLELGPDDDISELEGLMETFGCSYRRAFPMISMEENEDLAQYYLVDVADDKVNEFLIAAGKDKENVDAVELNGAVGLAQLPYFYLDSIVPTHTNDPDANRQWWLSYDDLKATFASLSKLKPRKKTIVAIIDTGVESKHEDLKGAWGKSPGKTDKHGHGTHCAGLAGAVANNGVGIASFNWEGRYVEVRGYKALGDNGQGSDFSVVEAMLAAVEDGADVLSMSLGSRRKPPKSQKDAVAYALKQNCIVVCAAGNDYGEDARNHSPSGIDGVISVAATTILGDRADFSNINTKLKMPIAAPGKDIYSTLNGGKYEMMSGTSMATPIVAGLIGVMRAIQPDLTAKEAWKILEETGFEGSSTAEVGKIINPAEALAKVLEEQ